MDYRKKRIIISILTITLLLPVVTYAKPDNAISTLAKSAIAIDNNTGRVLYGHNVDDRMPMASVTKIMTAIIAIEKCNMNDYVKIGVNSTYVGGSSLWLKSGEKIRMIDLLYGLMLKSGNDASVAISEYISGSTKSFVEMMNNKANQLGLYDTHFANPHGLDIDIDDHYTTARDLALLTRYALKNPLFKKIVATKYKTISNEKHNQIRQLKNHNKMLWLYDGVYGVKTGYTKKAGRCLVTACNKKGLDITVVTLNCPDDWKETSTILDYIYKNYTPKTVFNKGAILKYINVNSSSTNLIIERDIVIPMKKNEKLIYSILSIDTIDAPVKKGDVLGTLYIYNGNLKFPLIAQKTVNKGNFVEKVINILYNKLL
jgi:D-alanyl-D-alanine carboxypeptidase (penicillin-binding protein 5/6)